jgi:hypothetical protein
MKAPIKVPPGKVAWICLLVPVLLVAVSASASDWIREMLCALNLQLFATMG